MVNTLKSQLFHLESDFIEGATIRNKISWELDGEKCTKEFFMKLDKRREADETMNKIRTENGDITNNQKEIREEVRKYYETL